MYIARYVHVRILFLLPVKSDLHRFSCTLADVRTCYMHVYCMLVLIDSSCLHACWWMCVHIILFPCTSKMSEVPRYTFGTQHNWIPTLSYPVSRKSVVVR